MGTLYIVATPIGNLEDITLRAMKVLSEADMVLAEDTRVTKKLFEFLFTHHQFPFDKKLESYHQHTGEGKKLEILKALMDGKNIALVTDAGTPGVSDPGNELIDYLLSFQPDLKIIPIPGASALTSLLSVSGFDASKFIFLGFWPKKKAGKQIKLIKEVKVNIVFYESPYRIIKTLMLLEKEFGGDVRVSVGRELTKLHETLYRGKIRDVIDKLSKDTIKGELVVMMEYY